MLTSGLPATDSLFDGDEASEGVGGVVAADESRMAVSGEIKSTGSFRLRKSTWKGRLFRSESSYNGRGWLLWLWHAYEWPGL